MPSLDYFYVPTYGVERANEKGAVSATNPDGIGAETTNDNLLVSLWGIDSPAVSPVSYAGVIAPAYLDTAPFAPDTYAPGDDDRAPGFGQGMKSRVSCKYFYANAGASPKPATVLLHVLNPPQEYRQQLVDAVVFNGGDPADLANYTFKKSVQGNYGWNIQAVTVSGVGMNGQSGIDISATVFYSTVAPLGITPVPNTLWYPFLRTNGADGNPPEFFDNTTAAGVQEMLAAVNKGDFYVALSYSGDLVVNPTGGYMDIEWPHSVARG